VVPLLVCGSHTRNKVQGEMVLPDLQESSMRVSPKLVRCILLASGDFWKSEYHIKQFLYKSCSYMEIQRKF
jgi:hypothetical protein